MVLTFRQITEKDLDALDLVRGESLRKMHCLRMKRQKAGKAVYFLALLGKEPVGHIFLNYGKDNEWYEDVVLEDLYVRQDQRKKGFASEIMEYAERFVSQKGFSEMGLDVETHEHWIKKFYEGIGYVEVSGPHDLVYEGEKGKVREKIVHLRKQL